MSLEQYFPKRTKRDRVRSAKKRRKYNSKNRKWAIRIHKKGFNLVCGTWTLCLDCGQENYNTRIGCSCWTIEKKDLKGVIYGVHFLIDIGNGFKKPLANKSVFMSFDDLKIKLENNLRFFDISSKEEILLNNI